MTTAILKMGTASLYERSLEITEFATKELYELIAVLKEAMHVQGGVGIAAPQIGVNLRLILFGFEHNPRYPNEKPVPLTVLINPIITPLSSEIIQGWEGCLSVPGLRGKVPRYHSIQYSGFNQQGLKITQLAESFHARMVQHECDHLDGILFPQRITDPQNFGYEDVLWQRIYGATPS